MPIYKLLLTVTLVAVLQGVSTTDAAETAASATKRERPMGSKNDQTPPLTSEQFEATISEVEALYKSGEIVKAASILIQLMESAANDHGRELMAMVILDKPLPPELAPRFARAANRNEAILDELLRKTEGLLPSETVSEITTLRNESRKTLSREAKALREAEVLYERGGPTPEAEATLIEIIETTRNDEMQQRAVWVLCRHRVRPELALRIARAAKETDIIFALLSETAALPPDTVRELMTWLVMNDNLDSNTEYSKVAERGGIPDDFVPSVFPKASKKMHYPLLVLARSQLDVRNDEQLHRFMVNVIYGEYPLENRDRAGSYLSNAYRENNTLARDRFRIDSASIQRFFGSVPEFTQRLMVLLRDPESLGSGYYSTVREHVTYAFNEVAPSVAPAFFAEEAATHKLVRALLDVVGKNNYPQDLREAMLKFLGIIGTHPRWRNEVATELFKFAGRKNDEALLNAAVNALAAVPGRIDLTEADSIKEGTIGDRLADRVAKMVTTSPTVVLKLSRQFHKVEIEDRARQRILAQLLAAAMLQNDGEVLGSVKKLVPAEITNPLLAYNLACDGARKKDRVAMFKYTKLALSLGKAGGQFRSDSDFAPYLEDKEFAELLDVVHHK